MMHLSHTLCDETCDERSSRWHAVNQGMLVDGVSSATDCAQAIENRYSECRTKITIAATAGRRFTDITINHLAKPLRKREQLTNRRRSLHRRTSDLASDIDLDSISRRPQPAHETTDAICLHQIRDPNVDKGVGFGSNHISASAPADDAYVNCRPQAWIAEALHILDDSGQLCDCTSTGLRIDTGVGGATPDRDLKTTYAFSRGFECSIETGFEHQHCAYLSRRRLDEGARMYALDFFVGIE
jgi:hypothetical protein